MYSRSLKSASTFAETAKEVLGLSSPLPVYHDQGGQDGNLDALLTSPDIDAVIIALPITTQPDVIRRAWEHGKHVLSEKPVAPSVAEGILLIREYDEKYKEKIIWRVAENEEAGTANREVGKLVKAGIIGKVAWWSLNAVGSISRDNPWYNTPWRTVPDVSHSFFKLFISEKPSSDISNLIQPLPIYAVSRWIPGSHFCSSANLILN